MTNRPLISPDTSFIFSLQIDPVALCLTYYHGERYCKLSQNHHPPPMSSQQDLPVGQTKPNEEEGETGPTKNALKKAQKEEKKAREKAEKAARIEAQEKQKRDEAEANDTSKGKYGPLVLSSPGPAIVDLIDIHPGIEGEVVTAWARVENARVQSAKLAFLVLRQGGESIQAVVAGGGQHQISRQMVKWSGSINTESIVRVTGLVKRTEEEVKSASLGSVELHVEQLFEEAQAAEKLPTQYKDCLRTESESESQGLPIVSLSTRLDNPVIDKRTPANRAIFKLQSAISYLFLEYMEKHDFTLIHSSKIVGTATEGGADVFEMNYFDKPAYLTQSPQIFKQMAISMDMERVCEIGPVFRAEKSNTHRHVAEVNPPIFSSKANPTNPRHSTVHRPRLRNGHQKPLPRSPLLWRIPHDPHPPLPANQPQIHRPNLHNRKNLPGRRQFQTPTRRHHPPTHLCRSRRSPQRSRHPQRSRREMRPVR